MAKRLAPLLFSKLAWSDVISLSKNCLEIMSVVKPYLFSDRFNRERGVSQKPNHLTELDPEDLFFGPSFKRCLHAPFERATGD
jgi:hypothetical protein